MPFLMSAMALLWRRGLLPVRTEGVGNRHVTGWIQGRCGGSNNEGRYSEGQQWGMQRAG